MGDDIETLLRKAACITIDDGIPVERCVLSRELVIKAADALSELARLRAEREWKPIGELADLTPALVGSEGEYPTMAWRAKDGRWAVSEFDALQWTPTHYMPLPDEPPVQSHEEKQG